MVSSNCTQTDSPEALPSSYTLPVHIPLTILYSIDIMFAVILNSIVLRFFIIGRIKKNAFTILLMNLTIADLVTAVGYIPFISVNPTVLRNVSQTAANFLCTIMEGQVLFWIPNTVSMFTVMAISVNRYIIICKPIDKLAFYVKKHIVSYRCIAVTWLLAITLNIPNFISRRFEPCHAYCKRVWPKHLSATGYSLSIVIMGFLAPLILMCFCFLSAVRSFKSQESLIDNNPKVRKSRRQALKILGFLIFALILCWLPFTIYWLMVYTIQSFPSGIKGHYVKMKVIYVTLLFGLTNPVINPLVYGFRLAQKPKKDQKVKKAGVDKTTSYTIPLKALDHDN